MTGTSLRKATELERAQATARKIAEECTQIWMVDHLVNARRHLHVDVLNRMVKLSHSESRFFMDIARGDNGLLILTIVAEGIESGNTYHVSYATCKREEIQSIIDAMLEPWGGIKECEDTQDIIMRAMQKAKASQ